MLRSLVGSEMCIRDRPPPPSPLSPRIDSSYNPVPPVFYPPRQEAEESSYNPYLPPQNKKEDSTNQQPNNSEQTNQDEATTDSFDSKLLKLKTSGENPFREDADDLEKVIMNDLNIKQEIDALARIFSFDDSTDDKKKQSSDSR